MLFDTYQTQAAEAGLDALWLRSKVISNNLANAETPGFKASSVGFDQVLQNAARRRSNQVPRTPVGVSGSTERSVNTQSSRDANQLSRTEQGALSPAGGNTLFRTTVVQNDDTSVRIDGNNVSLEKEQTELWKAYAQYSYLIDRVSGHYANINSAITKMGGG